jgi:hypothetical protein
LPYLAMKNTRKMYIGKPKTDIIVRLVKVSFVTEEVARCYFSSIERVSDKKSLINDHCIAW